MRSIIGQCPDCCECPTPTLQWDSRSASKTKCGFSTTCSTRVFLTKDWDGYCFSNGASPPASYCTDTTFGTGLPLQAVYLTYTQTADPDTCAITDGPITGTDCFFDPTNPPYAFRRYVLSDEYFTADLITNTLAALPAYDDDWNDTAGSYRNLTTDELTYSVRESRYRFIFQVPKVGIGTCYKITWKEVFTPDVGDPTETDRCAIWNGDLLESGIGIVGDGTNPYFELAIPSTNGTTTVTDVVATCRGCEAGCPE